MEKIGKMFTKKRFWGVLLVGIGLAKGIWGEIDETLIGIGLAQFGVGAADAKQRKRKEL